MKINFCPMSPEPINEIDDPAIQQEQQRIMALIEAEQASPAALAFHQQLDLDLGGTMVLISHLQLALRHPSNVGASSEMARQIVDAMIDRVETAGLPGFAELLRTGDVPEFDL